MVDILVDTYTVEAFNEDSLKWTCQWCADLISMCVKLEHH